MDTERELKNGRFERKGLVVRNHRKAFVFFDDSIGAEYWVPYKALKDWFFTDTRTKKHADVTDLELNDEITVILPGWFLMREGVL